MDPLRPFYAFTMAKGLFTSHGSFAVMKFFGILALLTALLPAAQAQEARCSLSYRPHTDETAFAAVGSSLKVADRRCLNKFLIIPFDQQSQAVNFPRGQYQETASDDGYLTFDIKNSDGTEVQTCLWCDPLKAVSVTAPPDGQLCVTTAFNVRSCSLPGSMSYAVTERTVSEDSVCVPSLMYFGRSGSLLRFAVNDCKAQTRPTLTYDLSYGSVIRFLNERYEVLSADNQGIRFRRLKEPLRRPGDL